MSPCRLHSIQEDRAVCDYSSQVFQIETSQPFLYLIQHTYQLPVFLSPSLSVLSPFCESRTQGGLCRLLSGFVPSSGLSANAEVQLIGIIRLLRSDFFAYVWMCVRGHLPCLCQYKCSQMPACVCACALVCVMLNKQLSILINMLRGMPEAQVAQLDADTLDIWAEAQAHLPSFTLGCGRRR